MTKLEQAKKVKKHTHVKLKYEKQDAELVVAFLKNEVSINQVSEVWKTSRQNVYPRITTCLLHAIKNKWITIELL